MVSFSPVSDGSTTAGLLVHASGSWYDALVRGQFDFFEKLGARARDDSVQPAVVRAETDLSARLLEDKRRLHIMIGPRNPVRRGVLHAHPGYIRGFWYLDPLGVNMRSSIARQTFTPAEINEADARWFFNGVSGYMLRENVSKFPQQPRAAEALVPAFATVFTQEIEHFKSPMHYIDTVTMLSEVAQAAQGARVYVKLHPAQSAAVAQKIRLVAEKWRNIEVSSASVHDLISVSEFIVTQNSACGFEAIMQRKKVITCGQSDYHHNTFVAKSPARLQAGLTGEFPVRNGIRHVKYFYWFLAVNQLESAKPEFADRAWAICNSHRLPH